MILVRNVFQAKPGQADALLAGFQASEAAMREVAEGRAPRVRYLTDLSGPFDTVVMELEVESLAEWEQVRSRLFSDPRAQEAMAQGRELIESGRSELFTIR
jgi:hypothetical protein